MKSRTQGSRPRPRAQKNFEAKDRPSRGQGHGQRRKYSPKKEGLQNFFSGKKVFKNFFSGDFHLRKTKKVFTNFLRGFWRFPTKFQQFKKQCCPRAEDRAIFEDLRLRGQAKAKDFKMYPRGLHLCY